MKYKTIVERYTEGAAYLAAHPAIIEAITAEATDKQLKEIYFTFSGDADGDDFDDTAIEYDEHVMLDLLLDRRAELRQALYARERAEAD